jgi:hypothetical protein
MYKITVDRSAHIIRADLSGFFSPAEVAAFGRDEQAAARSLGCGSGEFGLLICALEGTVQDQQVVAEFRRLLAGLPLQAGRIAFVTTSALLTLQLRRIIPADRGGLFDTVAEGLCWLKSIH